ncbi:MAG: DUF4173 domain-containing protein [Campylobacterota bacterium]|nr:DUF4173 domain-containing protein [Campylobacterota bacterium]
MIPTAPIKNPLDNLSLILTILSVSFTLAIIKNLAPYSLVASWDIISYLLLLLPLGQMIYSREIANPFAKWIVPFIFILIGDAFYYNNELASELLPPVIYIMIGILYLGSRQSMDYFFQVLIPKLSHTFGIFGAIGILIKPILSLQKYREEMFKNRLYMRIGLAMVITLPVMALFLALFMASDPNFSHFIEDIFSFTNPFESKDIFTIPILFFLFLVIYGYALSNDSSRIINLDTNPFDPIVIGIFLGMLNLLFVSFLLFQLAYIFGGESYINETGLNIAYYAREGFFQLATVMSIVIIIFLVVIYRYKNEKLTALMMSGLMLQTMIMGYASLKKMHLYQSLKGATVLRYYVEWFDYMLLLLLLTGIIYLFTKRPFYQMLNLVAIVGLVSFATVASVNIDGMVARQNIAQFANAPKELDRELLSTLSIDALPYLHEVDVKISISPYRQRDCSKFSNYNIGYCNKLAKYGYKNINLLRDWSVRQRSDRVY